MISGVGEEGGAVFSVDSKAWSDKIGISTLGCLKPNKLAQQIKIRLSKENIMPSIGELLEIKNAEIWSDYGS